MIVLGSFCLTSMLDVMLLWRLFEIFSFFCDGSMPFRMDACLATGYPTFAATVLPLNTCLNITPAAVVDCTKGFVSFSLSWIPMPAGFTALCVGDTFTLVGFAGPLDSIN